MQRLGDGSWVISASDLTVLGSCPWRVARIVDEKLGKGVRVPDVTDPMMELVARLGLEHEARQWAQLESTLATVVEISYDRDIPGSDASAWRANIERAAGDTHQALTSQADAIFQGVFFQRVLPDAPFPAGFQGFADFLVRTDACWEVWDSKLARSAKDSALIQLASYVDQLQQLGVKASTDVRIILGDGTHSIHDSTDLLPLYFQARQSLLNLMQERIEDPLPSPWADPRYVACGTKGCPACAEQIALNDDLFQIAGLRKTQREKLRLAGFTTMTDFANTPRSAVLQRTSGIAVDTLAMTHLQATLQVATRNNPDSEAAWEVLSEGMLGRIPPAHRADVFFDFEGDPHYQELDSAGHLLGGLSHGDESVWFGLEYLFGLYGEGLGDGGFWGIWSDNFDEEKRALETFCHAMTQRLDNNPGMHIYHYAPYEVTKLLALSARHNIGQDCVARLREGVLVDLYPIVMKGVRIGLPSYSLKSLEALYFDPGTRTGIAGGGESVAAFVDYLTARSAGLGDEAQAIKEGIIHYNRIDCISTQALRDWLLGIREVSD
jgi:predicted RecB family nuclease